MVEVLIWLNTSTQEEPPRAGCPGIAFELLQEWRLYNLSGQSVSVLSSLPKKKVFPDIPKETSVFQLGPVSRHH